jgi:hypothetical protein
MLSVVAPMILHHYASMTPVKKSVHDIMLEYSQTGIF